MSTVILIDGRVVADFRRTSGTTKRAANEAETPIHKKVRDGGCFCCCMETLEIGNRNPLELRRGAMLQLLVASGLGWFWGREKALNFLNVATVYQWLTVEGPLAWPACYPFKLAR